MQFNQLIDLLKQHIDRLKKIKSSTIRFRINSYLRAIDQIESKYPLNERITKDKLIDLSLTKHMEQIMIELLNGKFLDIHNNNTILTNKKPIVHNNNKKLLMNINGIGEQKANELILNGLTNINQLKLKRFNELLSTETKLFLKFHPDEKIPHRDIQQVEKKLHSIKAKLIFVGSYRRKKPFSSDIDIMVVSQKKTILKTLSNKIIDLYNGKAYPYSQGEDRLSILVDDGKVYKLDLFRVDKDNYVSMLLYSTGSKQFNIKMRAIAKRKNYLLNQNGLFYKKNNELIKVKGLNKEEDYFKILGMKYLPPEQRI